jgi:hypothetical protein
MKQGNGWTRRKIVMSSQFQCRFQATQAVVAPEDEINLLQCLLLLFLYSRKPHSPESVFYRSRWASKTPTFSISYKKRTLWLELEICYLDLKSFIITPCHLMQIVGVPYKSIWPSLVCVIFLFFFQGPLLRRWTLWIKFLF